MPMFYTVPENVLMTEDGHPGIKAEYFKNKEFAGQPVFSSIDKTLDANWYDKAPREDMDDDNFSVRWTGMLQPGLTGVYQLGFIGTCNTRLYLDDSIVAKTVYHFRDEYGDPRLRKSVPIKLEAGKKYKIKVEAAETFADAQVQLVWAAPKPNLKKEAIEIARQADVVIMCMGITPRMEGEEMDVQIDGFRGGDRTKLDLPGVQQQLIKDISALGKPVVLVLLNGSALAINWEEANISAIVEAWYPGQAAGQAIADVLFGDYNPGGRLPVTFYKSEKDLPLFTDYNISTQTYRYFKGEPLYPFGYGLSYTTFGYDNLKVNNQYKAGEAIELSLDVKNTGSLGGDEVVQVYVSGKGAATKGPLRSLKAFKRIYLNAGEQQTVKFVLPSSSFITVTDKNERVIVPGKYEISAGGGQPGVKTKKQTSAILSREISLL